MPRCLFLPDNLSALLYEEQKLIQGILDFPFRKTIPFFKTEKEFNSIIIFPPIAHGTLILRPCNTVNSDEGFILGDAGSKADYVIDSLKFLAAKSNYKVFSVIKCKSWYYAQADFTEDEKSGLFTWSIKNKIWKKKMQPPPSSTAKPL